MKSAISNWIYLIYGYSIEIQISDIVYYKVCSIWYTKHFIFERSLASQNCFVALWHLWIVVLMLSTSQIEEVLQNCLIWENRKHYTKLQWSVLQQSLLQLQLYSTTPLQENYNFNLTYNYTLYNHNCNLQPNYITLQLHLQDTRPTTRNYRCNYNCNCCNCDYNFNHRPLPLPLQQLELQLLTNYNYNHKYKAELQLFLFAF